MVAVNGVPVVPRIWNDGSLGPFGVLPTLPENPVWLLQAAMQTASIAVVTPIDRVRTKCLIVPLFIAITVAARACCCRRRGTSRRGSGRWSGTSELASEWQ